VAEGAQEVVGVEFEEVCVHNALSLLHLRVSLLLPGFLRKVSEVNTEVGLEQPFEWPENSTMALQKPTAV